MKRRKTAGELVLKAASDPTKYDSLEVGHALCDDVMSQLKICAQKHCSIIDEPEFCIVMLLVDDPLIKGILRRKFYAWPYLPSPRPRQSCFLYKKSTDSFSRLWVLPDAITMGIASEMVNISPQWRTMQQWSKAFYHGWYYDKESNKYINKDPTYFFKYIRHQHNIDMPSESEYLNANREKLIQAGCKQVESGFSEAFDFSKITIDKIIDTKTALPQEDSLDGFRQAQNL
jgi:hypothetical protein